MANFFSDLGRQLGLRNRQPSKLVQDNISGEILRLVSDATLKLSRDGYQPDYEAFAAQVLCTYQTMLTSKATLGHGTDFSKPIPSGDDNIVGLVCIGDRNNVNDHFVVQIDRHPEGFSTLPKVIGLKEFVEQAQVKTTDEIFASLPRKSYDNNPTPVAQLVL